MQQPLTLSPQSKPKVPFPTAAAIRTWDAGYVHRPSVASTPIGSSAAATKPLPSTQPRPVPPMTQYNPLKRTRVPVPIGPRGPFQINGEPKPYRQPVLSCVRNSRSMRHAT